MASEAQSQATKAPEKTFRNYDATQAQTYAQYRSPYPQQLISTIIDYHVNSSPDPEAALTTIVDVGCGPGSATRVIGSYFDNAIGFDAGQSMIDTAKQLGGKTKTGKDIQYGLSTAEGVDEALKALGVWDGQAPCVDLITSAMAAHWFDMPSFLSAAAKVLKPGGSVMVWASGDSHIDRRKYPADIVEKLNIGKAKFNKIIGEYELEGNRLTRGLYKDLKMPWDVDAEKQKELGLDVFDKEKSIRKTWNEDGEIDESLEGGWMWKMDVSWKFAKMAMSTASPVTRLREANKAALESGEMKDPVEEAVESMRDIVGRDVEMFHGGVDCVVVMVKKKV
jgi:trans-aconitate 3-methyltransferase